MTEKEILILIDDYGMYLFVLPFLLNMFWHRLRSRDFNRAAKEIEKITGKKQPRGLYCHWVLFKPPWIENKELKKLHYRYCWEVHAFFWGSVLMILLFGFFVISFFDLGLLTK